jgi:uncharacterized protein (TIGR03084 family)
MSTDTRNPSSPQGSPPRRPAGAFDALLDDLVAETASLRRVLAGLTERDWDTPTPATGWNIRDQVSHLAYFDGAALLALEDPERFTVEAAALAERGDDFTGAIAAEHRHRSPGDLLDWLDEARTTLVAAYRGAEPRARTPWYGPPMSVMSAATARLMETWAHGIDVVDALGLDPEDTTRLRHIAHLGHRTVGFTFALHHLEIPTAPVRVELTNGARTWTFGPDEAADVVRGRALDFCLVVAQRRNVRDTTLVVEGPVATAWMDTAQIFAGAATLPPPPGTRAGGERVARNLIQRVNVGDLLTRSARRTPGAEAVVDGDRRWTFADFDAWVNRVANGLSERGYGPGDRLALASPNSAEFLAVYFACSKLGVVVVPINLGWSPDEIAYVLGHSRARGLAATPELLPGLTAALDASPGVGHVVALGTGAVGGRTVETLDDLAVADAAAPEVVVGDRDAVSILYTSGTTSAPKGVVGSHLAVYVESLSMAVECAMVPTDRFVAMLPMFHTAQLNVHCTAAVAVGASIHVMRTFDPGALLAMIESQHITQIFGLPMMYRAMLDHPDIGRRNLDSLRRATYAMAPMAEGDLRRAIEVFGCDFCLVFGQTEMSPATTIFRPEHQLSHLGAAGTPVVNVEVAIMGPDGALLPTGEQGEIVYRGPHAMTGYLDDPGATAAAFAHGWFHSGDAGAFDRDGILWFRDRFKDVIKTGGENVASLEVEKAILSQVPGVAEAAVIGLRHDRWSEAITAFVVPAPGAVVDLDSVRAALRDHLDGYKMPKAVVTVETLPRTSTGKVRKTELRTGYADLYGERP